MNRLNRTLGVLTACALFGATTAHASGFRGGRDCGGFSFGTCSAVHMNVAEGRLAVGQMSTSWHDWEVVGSRRNFEFRPISDGSRNGHVDPVTVSGCPVPSGNPLDCPPVTVTPEPVTMTLLASGLLSMSGVGLIRRRRQRLTE